MNETYFVVHTDCKVQIILVLVTSRRISNTGPLYRAGEKDSVKKEFLWGLVSHFSLGKFITKSRLQNLLGVQCQPTPCSPLISKQAQSLVKSFDPWHYTFLALREGWGLNPNRNLPTRIYKRHQLSVSRNVIVLGFRSIYKFMPWYAILCQLPYMWPN